MTLSDQAGEVEPSQRKVKIADQRSQSSQSNTAFGKLSLQKLASTSFEKGKSIDRSPSPIPEESREDAGSKPPPLLPRASVLKKTTSFDDQKKDEEQKPKETEEQKLQRSGSKKQPLSKQVSIASIASASAMIRSASTKSTKSTKSSASQPKPEAPAPPPKPDALAPPPKPQAAAPPPAADEPVTTKLRGKSKATGQVVGGWI